MEKEFLKVCKCCGRAAENGYKRIIDQKIVEMCCDKSHLAFIVCPSSQSAFLKKFQTERKNKKGK